MILNSIETAYTERLKKACEWLQKADFVLIGAGAGLSTAAGLKYDGPEFEKAFADMISRYAFTDLYTSSFYPFATEEERWAYWSRHVMYARFDPPALPLYQQLLELVREKDYFVITTNVDGQFRKAGFDAERLFEVQGDYGYIQGATGADGHTYYAEDLFRRMVAEQKDCAIPTALVPSLRQFNSDAPKDEAMDIHVRKDIHFVEDEQWNHTQEQYESFLQRAIDGQSPIALLELVVGFNTPSIIRFPFERLAARLPRTALIRVNKDYPQFQLSGIEHFVGFQEPPQQLISDILSNI